MARKKAKATDSGQERPAKRTAKSSRRRPARRRPVSAKRRRPAPVARDSQVRAPPADPARTKTRAAGHVARAVKPHGEERPVARGRVGAGSVRRVARPTLRRPRKHPRQGADSPAARATSPARAGPRRVRERYERRSYVGGGQNRTARRASQAPPAHRKQPCADGGRPDAKWEDAYAVGDEAPGGDNPTPDQTRVDEIGRALGVEYQDDQELQGGDELTERDEHRWELDPASSDDWPHRDEDDDFGIPNSDF